MYRSWVVIFWSASLDYYYCRTVKCWLSVLCKVATSLSFYVFVLFTGPPPIPAEPVVTPEAAYVSKVQYGKT